MMPSIHGLQYIATHFHSSLFFNFFIAPLLLASFGAVSDSKTTAFCNGFAPSADPPAPRDRISEAIQFGLVLLLLLRVSQFFVEIYYFSLGFLSFSWSWFYLRFLQFFADNCWFPLGFISYSWFLIQCCLFYSGLLQFSIAVFWFPVGFIALSWFIIPFGWFYLRFLCFVVGMYGSCLGSIVCSLLVAQFC